VVWKRFAQAEMSAKVEQLCVIQKWSSSRSTILYVGESGVDTEGEGKLGFVSAVVGLGSNVDWTLGAPSWGLKEEGQI
jgi:hypothetical protein